MKIFFSLCVLFVFSVACRIPSKSLCDINGDGKANDMDFVEFQNTFGSERGGPNWNKRADLDGDGVILGGDFLIYRQKCGGSK